MTSVLAGAGAHLASTAVLGLVITFLGAEALERIGPAAELAGAGILIAFGGVLLARGVAAATRRVRRHTSVYCQGAARTHAHAHTHPAPVTVGRPAGAGHLLQGAVLGLRPCAEAVAVFLAAAAYGVAPSLLAIAGWVLTSALAMVGAVWLSLRGLRGLKSEFLTRYGELAAGAVILVMGVVAAIVGLLLEG